MVTDEQFLAALDPPRRMLVMRMRECGLNYASLSRHVKRNPTYIHQYIDKKSPKHLSDRDRKRLADLLSIPESLLRTADSFADVTDSVLPVAPNTSAAAIGSSMDVPVFSEDEEIDPAKATEWTARPRHLATSGNAFAIWVRRGRGRLRTGDLAYVGAGQPPRVGDGVVIMAGRRIVAIGDLDQADDGFTVDGTTFPAATHRALKISGIVFS